MDDSLFVDRFLQVAKRDERKTAIIDRGNAALTYGELWDLSGWVANRLRQSGVGRESVVGIALTKSAEFIATIIGCWRLRAAYVPLDPSLPNQRLQCMVEDARAQWVIADRTGTTLLSGEPWHVRIIDWPECVECPSSSDVLDKGTPSDLAWIIFTSGTTGQPRGVEIEHRGFANVIDVQRAAFRVTASSRVLLFYSTSFDASLSDIGTALLSGATLCVEDVDSVTRAGSILNLIRQRNITHADIPPSMLALHRADDVPECLETVIIGGEACSQDVVQDWADRVRLINVYGPTEATICTSLCECRETTWSRPLLGTPLPGIEYVVVGVNDEPVTAGQSGELLIGGDCLARGYAGSPEQTSRKFIRGGERRFYRTGDLVRVDADGEYVFLGRIDRQLSVRGFRIEPEEIESALHRIEGVISCAVVYRPLNRDRDPAGRQLVAFIEASRRLHARALEEQIRQLLPPHMIPSRFEFVSAIPTNASHKPDYAWLHSSELSRKRGCLPADLDASHVQHDCDGNSELLSIIRSVLNEPSLQPDDDLFDMGADSLSVLAISAAAQSRGISLSPLTISRERTVSQLCVLPTAPSNTEARAADWLREDVRRLVNQCAGCGGESTHGEPQLTLHTGSTGFLGSRVLVNWLRTFPGRAICLVRASDDASARERLTTSLTRNGMKPSSFLSRVQVVAGDISKDNFGWSPQRWETFAQQVDTIVHNAARVHVFAPYEELRTANVVGTANVVKFALAHRVKRLHYASTLSVFVGSDQNRGMAFEDDDLTKTSFLYGGYAQSKWAAEVLLRAVDGSSMPLDIYRFGLLTGDSETSEFPRHDLFAMTVRGLLMLRCVPVGETELEVDVTPVDFAARAMVEIARQQMLQRHRSGDAVSTWHIANPESLKSGRLFDVIADCGTDIDRVGSTEFIGRAREQSGTNQAAACLSLCRWLSETGQCDVIRPLDLFQATEIQFEMTRTLRALSAAGIHCPPPSRQLIRRYITHILRTE